MTERKWTKSGFIVRKVKTKEDLNILFEYIKDEVDKFGLPVIAKINISIFDIYCSHCGQEINLDNMSSYKGIAMCKKCKSAPKEWKGTIIGDEHEDPRVKNLSMDWEEESTT